MSQVGNDLMKGGCALTLIPVVLVVLLGLLGLAWAVHPAFCLVLVFTLGFVFIMAMNNDSQG